MLKRAESLGLPLKRGASSESETTDILAKRQKRFGNVGNDVCLFFKSFLFVVVCKNRID